MKRGVYFIANDRVLDLAIAFLNSFRVHNETIDLCLIPYNSDFEKISLLKKKYNFCVFENSSLLNTCDEISIKFHGTVNGAYRKLAMWEGEFDEFIYIDVDTIVLDNIEFAFRFLDDYSCLTSHSDIPSIRKFVWKDTIYKTSTLDSRQIAFSANTGFIVSKLGFLPMKSIQNRLSDALTMKEHMELFCQEQPFLNYLIVTSGEPYTSLFVLFHFYRIRENIMLESWAGTRGVVLQNGKFKNRYQAPLFLLHWAGLWQPRNVDFRLHKILKFLRMNSDDDLPKLHIFMPYKKIWNHFRNLDHPLQENIKSSN